MVNDQLPSSNPDNVQLPPESELPAAEAFPLDFDRGRYPAQRRRRGGASYTPPAKPKSHHKKVKAPAVTSTPIPNGYIAAGCAPDPSTQTMQQAMSNFHRSSGSPMSQTTPQNAPSSVNSSEQSTGRTTMAPSSIAVTSANTLPLAHPPKAGGTYWPENRKRALAEAARKALRSSESNSGKQITTDEIHDLFNQNPSYTQMCEVLEFRGFTIDRSQFARLLLKAVPDLGSASTASISTQQPPSPKQTPVQQSVSRLLHSSPQTNTNGYETPYAAPGASRPPQPQQPHQAQAPPQGPGFIGLNPGLTRPTGPPFTGIAVASTSGQVNTSEIATKNGVKWADQQNPNADSLQLNHLSTKEQMAKKRSFSDIVDLTALSDDEVEEIEPPSQRPRLDNGPPTSAAAALISPPLVTDQAPKKVFETVTLRRLQNESAAATSFQKDKPNLEAFKLQSSRREILQCQDIVRPMNKRQDALRRSSYTAKTIARDILVSMGKHSTMRRLNAHLESLREKFQAVDYNSDLSTFKWDLVDPGGEPVQAPRPGDEGHDADNEDAGGPALSRYHHRLFAEIGAGGKSGVSLLDNVSLHAPVKDIEARRKLGRPSRGSSQRGGFANSGARSKADGPGSYGQQQMPPPAPPLSSAITTNQSAHNFARFVRNYIPSMQTPFIGSTSGSPSFNGVANMTPPNPTSSHSYSNTPIINTPGSDDSPKKNGRRPSGAKNKQPRPDKGTAKKRKEALTTSTANADAPLRTPGSRDMSISTRPRTDTTPARPSGLRNAMSPTSSTGIAVVIPSRSTSIAGTPHAGSHAGSHTASAQSARRDGPKQGPAAVSDMHISQPEYKVYKCQWEKCPAELHNLETLKKHIRKHCYQYTRRDEPYPCLWANCFKPEDDGSNKGENLVFSTDVDWDIHMLKHMNAVAWNLGDGPATHSSGECRN